ncbi:hypothetical protein [Sorangium sp. So ce1024]|uniref:hypothetical protein n=1 Tax=unclassified Sorangium TaxID=2621164 RepID=UPI003F11A0A5
MSNKALDRLRTKELGSSGDTPGFQDAAGDKTAPPASLTVGSLALVRHTIATGGVMIVGGRSRVRLTPVQFALLELLARQMTEDEDNHESVRGFVPSSILICSLPWDTAHPDLSHLKQLVRRVRRRLIGSGVELQSWCGLGYRLVV